MRKYYTKYRHSDPVSCSGGVSLTDPQFLAECDINTILERFGATGQIKTRPSGIGGDFSSIGDYQACLDRINNAKDEFMNLPSNIRSRFGNDPTAYVDFVLDPQNQDECIRLGLREIHKEVRSPLEVLESIETRVTPSGVTSPSEK